MEALVILVVDDNEAIRRSLVRILSPLGEVHIAADGVLARDLVQDGLRPRHILCDVDMPNMSGPVFHAWLEKEHPVLADRLVFMTGGVPAHLQEALEASQRRVVEKPVDLKVLLSLMGD